MVQIWQRSCLVWMRKIRGNCAWKSKTFLMSSWDFILLFTMSFTFIKTLHECKIPVKCHESFQIIQFYVVTEEVALPLLVSEIIYGRLVLFPIINRWSHLGLQISLLEGFCTMNLLFKMQMHYSGFSFSFCLFW